MINIENKENCCGCEACGQICPKSCITMTRDSEGFLYPKVDVEMCVECGACVKVCPVINPSMQREPLKLYGAKNIDSAVRKESTSGGLFREFALKVIEEGGVVFGAKFDQDNRVVHSYALTAQELVAFSGSKYVQSQIGESFKEARKFLREGRKVLFSASPCQIAGLHGYLGKKYDNLFAVDFICHGVPSPAIFRGYIDELIESKKIDKIDTISFRSKQKSWRHYGLYLKYESRGSEQSFYQSRYSNPFLLGFLSDLYLRPSCHSCPAKGGASQSDITLADFWGVERANASFSDDKGVSLIIVNSQKGESEFSVIKKESIEVGREFLQSPFYKSSTPNPRRGEFFEAVKNSDNITSTIKSFTKVSLRVQLSRLKTMIKTEIRHRLNK